MGKKRKKDEDSYSEDEEDGKKPTKKQRQNKKAAIAKSMNKDETKDFLNQHFKFIKEKAEDGVPPATIAEMLCVEVKRPGAVTNKQISNFVYQKKKAGQIQTYRVSGKNSNLRAKSSHQAQGCMLFFINILGLSYFSRAR
jgi:hypothetical protein